jgi:hypothetical protein
MKLSKWINYSDRDLINTDQGLVEKEKLESFNLPIYGRSVGEVEDLVTQSGLFSMDLIKQFEMNWDPFDDSERSQKHECRQVHQIRAEVFNCLPFWRSHN